MAPTGTQVKIRDVGINLFRLGRGKPLLFLHGANGVSAWLPLFDELSKSYDLLVPEHPGFGRSQDPSWIRNVPDLAMFYLDFLEALDLEDVHLVGTSLGGWIAAEIAIRNTSRLSSATLVAPAGVRVKGVPMGDLFIWSAEEATRNLFFDQSIADRLLAMQPTEEQIDLQLKNRFAATKFAWQPRLFNPDLEKWLHRIKIPTQIIWGRHDKIIPSAYAERWRERIPHAELTMIDDCGHVPHIEKAGVMSNAIKSFLGRGAA